MPSVSKLSLIVIGRPCSGPSTRPCASARSAASACARARAAASVTTALMRGSCFATRSSCELEQLAALELAACAAAAELAGGAEREIAHRELLWCVDPTGIVPCAAVAADGVEGNVGSSEALTRGIRVKVSSKLRGGALAPADERVLLRVLDPDLERGARDGAARLARVADHRRRGPRRGSARAGRGRRAARARPGRCVRVHIGVSPDARRSAR